MVRQLGRFAQADTIVPTGVQGYDRYAYVNNSPLNYVDPSGHNPCQGAESGYRCHRELEKALLDEQGDGLGAEQIMQLLGFDNISTYQSWLKLNSNNNLLSTLLGTAQVGDIVSLQFGENPYNHMMIVKHGKGIAFYDIGSRKLLNSGDLNRFTSGSSTYLRGAGILRDSTMTGTYSLPSPGHQFGVNISGMNYTLPDGWNEASNGQGGVVFHKQLDVNDAASLVAITVGVDFVGGPVVAAVALAACIFLL